MLTDLIIHQKLHTTKYEPFIHFTEAPAPELSEVQSTAVDLHSRGLNIVPVMKHSKKPFVLEPLFHTRLHHCTDLCRHRGSFNVAELFTRRNIGLMTGKTSGNLFDIDCDSQEAFTRIGEELSARGIPFWAVSTASGGRYLLRCKEGEVLNMPKGKTNFEDVEVWGNRHMVVVPPSIHPSGAFYQWVTPEPRLNLPVGQPPPVVSIRSLEFLGVTLRKKAVKPKDEEPALKNLPGWAKKLSKRNLQTILNAPDEGTRNNRLFALACDLKANGVDYGEAEAVVLDIARRAGTEDYEAVSTLKSAYSEERTAARNHYGTNPKGERSEDWTQAMEFAKSYDWRRTFGRKATSRRKVFFALVERAKLEGRKVFRATVRELAELAGTDYKFVSTCLKDLTEKGLIVRISAERKKYMPNQRHSRNNSNPPGLYRFADYAEYTTVINTGRYSVVNLEIPQTQAERDIFGKLGMTSWRVWRYLLLNEAPNGYRIAKALNLPPSSVYNALKLLEHPFIGLVTLSQAEGIYYGEPKTDESLAQIAAVMFDGGSPTQARTERHRVEREIHAFRLVAGAIAHAEGKDRN